MAQTEKQILVQVVTLIKQGENKEAVKALAELLAKQPKLEQGWYLMGMALDEPEKKKFAFERALKLNPNNDRAKQQLLKLEDAALPKQPAPIEVAPPSAPPPAISEDAPVISTPWITDEPEEEADVELPAWARDITPSPQESTSTSAFEPGSSTWDWQDEFPDEPARTTQEPEPAFSFQEEAEEEPEPEEKPKRRGLFRRKKDDDETSAEEAEIEDEEPKKKRKSRKEKKAEKQAEKLEKEEQDREKTLQEQLLDEKPKKNFRISWRPRKGLVVFIIFMMICGGLGYGGYYYQDELIPLVTQYAPTVISLLTQQPTATPDYTPVPTFTPASQPTLPPTWTPIGMEGPSLAIPTLPDLDITPTISPTPEPIETEIGEQMDAIEDQIFPIRGLSLRATVDRQVMLAASFEEYMHALALSRYDREAIAQQQIVLQAFGFIDSEYYHVEVLMNDLADFVGGFYYPEQNKIYLQGSGFYDPEQYIYAYEYGFALLDANYDIYSEFCQGSVDSCLAETALAVGDVTFTQELWLQENPLDFEAGEYYNLEDPKPVFQNYQTPPYFNAYRNFAVKYGYDFFTHLYDQGGWQTINYTYRYPPETSEQVMHPEKYDTRESRVLLYDPSLLSILGEGWELLQQDTLGEWRTSLLLSATDYPDAVLPEEEALTAAAGWGGDTYQMYLNSETGDVVLAVHWNWETTADLEEFFGAMQTSQSGRFQDTEFDGPGDGACWMLEDIAYSCLYQTNRDILWIYSTTFEALDTSFSAFGQFQ